MNDFLIPVASKGTVNFLEGLATGVASAINAIPGVPAINSRRFTIEAISLVSMENLDYQFSFFASAAGRTADVDTNRFISQIELFEGMGYQLDAAGLYYYYLDGLAIPYYMDGSGNSQSPPTLNVTLTNRSVAAKTAGAPGALTLTCWLRPMQTP